MASQEIAKREARDLHLPIGLLVSTGELVPTRDGKHTRPIALDHFRFKSGALDQYAAEAEKAIEVYGDEPRELNDILLLSNNLGEVLDVRVKAWGKSGLRILGMTNFAELPEDEYALRVDAWDDEILYFAREVSEVPSRLRADWQGEAIPSKLDGPDDPRIAKYQMHVEATLRFGLPRVLGLGKVALYSTGSKHNRDALKKALDFAYGAFRGNLLGVHFRLGIRQRRSSYFDGKKKAWLPTQVYEVVLDTPWTLQEAIDAIGGMRTALGAGEPPEKMLRELAAGSGAFFADGEERRQAEAEQAIIDAVATGPVPEETKLRDEPDRPRPTDAQLNRIAQLQAEIEPRMWAATLRGIFGVESPEDLDPEDAARYEETLSQYVASAEQKPDGGGEVIEDAEVVEEPASFEDMVPADVKEQQKRGRSR